MSDSTVRPRPQPSRQQPGQQLGQQPPRHPVARRPVAPVVPPTQYTPNVAASASTVPQTPPLTAEELAAAYAADDQRYLFVQGYDPARVPVAPAATGTVVPSWPEQEPIPGTYDNDDNDYQTPDDDVTDEEAYQTVAAAHEMAEGLLAIEEEGDPFAEVNPWDDGEIAPPPPTAMPVQYTRWLDLGDLSDQAMARKWRGWKIRCRMGVSLDFLRAAEALQDAAREAKLMEQRMAGKVRAEVRASHIQALLEDVIVAWNFVDERGYPLPQPPAGLGRIRDDLLAATLTRAIQEVVPSKKRLRASTPR